MEMWGFSLLLLARISVNQAQLKRQRTGETGLVQGAVQELSYPAEGGQQEAASPARDCPYQLLPWALLLALVGTLALYLLFTSVHGGVDPGPEGEASLERALLRDITSILHVIRPRLWQIAQAQRKQHQHQHRGERRSVKGR